MICNVKTGIRFRSLPVIGHGRDPAHVTPRSFCQVLQPEFWSILYASFAPIAAIRATPLKKKVVSMIEDGYPPSLFRPVGLTVCLRMGIHPLCFVIIAYILVEIRFAVTFNTPKNVLS